MQKIEWKNEFLHGINFGNYPKYPNEVMLKLIFGSYLEKPLKIDSKCKVLDVGCALGSNLIPFLDLGCEVYGVDIHKEIVENAKKIMNARGYDKVHFMEGTNQNLPYEDNYFDLILSINTLHYEDSEDGILNALSEFKRVMKIGGALYISTVGPEHEIYKRSKTLGHHLNLIQDFGFRNGEKFFFFDSEKYLEHYLSKFFSHIETGRVTERLMSMPLDFLVAFAKK